MTLYVEGRPKPVRLSAPSRHSQPFFEGRCSIAFILNGLHAKHVQLQSCFFVFFFHAFAHCQDIGLPHWLMHLFAMCNAGAFLHLAALNPQLQ